MSARCFIGAIILKRRYSFIHTLSSIVPVYQDYDYGYHYDALETDSNVTDDTTVLEYPEVPADSEVVFRDCVLQAPGWAPWLAWYITARPACNFVAYYVIPMALIGILYGMTARTLTNSVRWGAGRGGADKQHRKRRRAARYVIYTTWLDGDVPS
jgi:hypothetical protein